MIYVGVDISKDFFDCAYLMNPDQGYQTKRFQNDRSGFKQAVSWAPIDSHWVMEATGPYHQQFAWYLDGHHRAVSVVNPLVIKRYSQMRLVTAKTDVLDAMLIADFGRHHSPKQWHMPSRVKSELHQLHGWLDDLTGEQTRLKNRIEATSRLALPSPIVRKYQKAHLGQLGKKIKAMKKAIDELLTKEFSALYQRLQTIPGIAKTTAAELIMVTDGFGKFTTAKQLVSYAGMASYVDQSGKRTWGATGIAKRGNCRLRQLLYLCSWTAQRCNPACRSLAERLRAKGKPERKVKIAIAAKLLRQAFGVAMSGKNFDENIALGA